MNIYREESTFRLWLHTRQRHHTTHTDPHILALRRILKGVRAKSLSAVIMFVDFRKAFESVDRANMFTILKAYGIHD